MPETDSLLRRLRFPLLAIVSVFVIGVVGYLVLGFDFVDALSNTVLVLTTVGFSSRDPLDSADKLFTNVVAILGVSTYLAILAVAASALAEGQFGVMSRRRRALQRIARLRDHFVVCAYDRVGRAVARELIVQGVPFVVVDRKEELEPQMRADQVAYVIADPTSEEVLRLAGIEHARGLISAVDSDADNVFITLTARAIRPALFIVARASETGAADRLYRAGANRVISPYVSSGRHMARLALRPRMLDYLEIQAGEGTVVRIEELSIDEGSPLVGRTVAEASGGGTPLALRSADGRVVAAPREGQVLASGDVLVLLGGPTAGDGAGR